MPSSALRTTAASNVPPPRSYTATVRPASTRSALAYPMAAACGSVRNRTSGRPSASSASANARRLCSPHSTGWVTATASAGPSSRCATSATTRATNRAESTSAGTGRPATISGVPSPIRRLNSRTTRPGSDNARRAAGSPVSMVPSGARKTTEATAALAAPSATLSGRASPSRQIEAAVQVVPRSIPSW